MNYLLLAFLHLVITFPVVGATGYTIDGSISGRVITADGEAVPFAAIVLKMKSEVTRNTTSDDDGYYTFDGLDEGSYNVHVRSLGFQNARVDDIPVIPGETTKLNITLLRKDNALPPVIVKPYEEPIVDAEGLAHVFGPSEIDNAPTTELIELAASEPSVYMEDNDSPIQIRGARSGSTVYYVDGLPMHEVPDVPIRAVRKMQVLAGGIPAKYGDTTGGVVVIELKRPRMY